MYTVLATLTAMAIATTGAAAPTRVAFHPLDSRDASGEALQQLNAAVWTELRRIPAIELVSEKELVAALPAPCSQEIACLLRFGREVGAREVLFGGVKSLPDSFVLTLRLLDVATGEERDSATESVNRDVEEMVRAVRAQVLRLKAPERFAGQLTTSVPGAELVIDGKSVGPGPVALKPATYSVRLRSGKRDAEEWIEIRFDQRAVVSFESEGTKLAIHYEPADAVTGVLELGSGPEQPSPPRLEQGWPRWPGWAGLGAGGLLLAAGVVQHVRASLISSDIEALRGPTGNFKDPASASEVHALTRSLGRTNTSAWILTGAGLALGAAGGVWLLAAPTASADTPLAGATVAVAGTF